MAELFPHIHVFHGDHFAQPPIFYSPIFLSLFPVYYYLDTTARIDPKARSIACWGKSNISCGRNPVALKRRDNCWLAFVSTGGTGWLSPILGELVGSPGVPQDTIIGIEKEIDFQNLSSSACIIHTYAQKNTSVPLHTHPQTEPKCSHTCLNVHIYSKHANIQTQPCCR